MTQLTLTAPAAPLVPGPILVVGLNPSTADATTNDPTIAKLHRYTKAWGVPQTEPPIAYRESPRLSDLPAARRYILTRPGLIMTNLFSLRSTDPRGLIGVGEEGAGSVNEDAIAEAAALAGTILCAWGGPYNPKALGELVAARAKRVVDRLLREGHRLHVLALSKDGVPRHPLYLKGDLRPVIWRTP